MGLLSDHTYLINCVIGLTKRVTGWPSTLRDVGFKVEWISPLLTTGDGETVRPDLLLESNRLLRALVMECKGGQNINEDQLKRLLGLDLNSLLPRVSVYDPRRLKFEIAYACLGKNAKSLDRQISALEPLPVLAFDRDQILKLNDFGEQKLEVAFSDPIPVSDYAPTGFYPFDVEDDNGLVGQYVLTEVVRQSIKKTGHEPEEMVVEEILAAVHPLWDVIDEGARRALVTKAATVMNEFHKRGQLESIRRVRRGRSWRIVGTLQALRDECQALLDELTKQRQIDEFSRETPA